jgi:hypothetical protein
VKVHVAYLIFLKVLSLEPELNSPYFFVQSHAKANAKSSSFWHERCHDCFLFNTGKACHVYAPISVTVASSPFTQKGGGGVRGRKTLTLYSLPS